MQMHWRSSPFLGSPAGATEKVLVYSHDLYCPKLVLEDDQTPVGNLQVKEALETSAGPELRDWRFPYINYALYCILPDGPKEAVAIRRKAPKFYYNAITEHCITSRMMESSSAAYHIKRYRKHSKRLMIVCAELTNLVQNLGIDSEDYNIIG